MSTETFQIEVGGLTVEVLRKDIKNLHLAVYPPNGRVRVAAPTALGDEAIRLAVVERLGWIKRQQTKLAKQPRQSPREMVEGESHYYLGRRYRLAIQEAWGPQTIQLKGGHRLVLTVHPGANRNARWRALERWYREQLHLELEPMIHTWAEKMGVEVHDWRVRWMKTKWGSCSDAGRLWFNLELIRKPKRCIEYVVVHELAHLLERGHDERFVAVLDQHLPDWTTRRRELNESGVGFWHELAKNRAIGS